MMIGDLMALEVLAAMGGESNADRSEAFRKMCCAIVAHIQKYGQAVGTIQVLTIPVPGPPPVPGTGTFTGKIL